MNASTSSRRAKDTFKRSSRDADIARADASGTESVFDLARRIFANVPLEEWAALPPSVDLDTVIYGTAPSR